MSLLRLEGVTRRFSGLVALDGVSFEMDRGGIVGLIGPNGAGKSTLFSVISGYFGPTSGGVYYQDREVTGWRPHHAAAAGVARTFQLMRVFGSMSVLENVAVGGYLRTRRRREAFARAREVVHLTGLDAIADVPASSLTAPSKKRLEVARALVTDPTLLLLDEVLSGLTPAEGQEAVRLIRVISESGVTILMVEHVMEVIMPLCDRIIVLDHGQCIGDGPPAEVSRDPRVIEAYLGRGHADG